MQADTARPEVPSVIFAWNLDRVKLLPTFDLHTVEAALRVNHLLYDGKPMTESQIAEAVQEYRMFLQRHRAAGMPEKFEVPSLVIDRVWHTHMCETAQYATDCKSYFGQMFHHSSGMCNGGVEDNRSN
ncbi:MAG: glycine-rich domain-containing protein-like [Patescibacteria group bacterium]